MSILNLANPIAPAANDKKLRSKSAYKWTLVKRNWQLYLFVLPAAITFILFNYLPMYGVLISFKSYNMAAGIWDSPWAEPWYKYFKMFFSSPWFFRTIKNTLVLSLYGLIINSILPILLALMVNEVRNSFYKKIVQTATYIPYFISVVVLVGMVNLFFSTSTGLVNQVIKMLGHEPISFLTSEPAFKHLYVWSGVWQGTGWGSIIYFAALSNVSPELHEAATIDGAGRLQRIIHINIPALIPTFIIMLILGSGSIMSVSYQKILLMQNDLNVLASEVIQTYVYKVGLRNSQQYSYASAIGLFNNVINLILLITVNKISAKVSDTSLW